MADPTHDAGEPLPEGVACTNCGARLVGPYCHACGQRHRDRLLPLPALAAEGMEHVFSLDNRLVRSLRDLVRAPGVLTEAYLAGKRQLYLSPIRLYLVVSVGYFFVLALLVARLPIDSENTATALELVRHMPKVMFVLVPAYAGLLALAFRARQRLYTEHLVFALHLHTFAFLLLAGQSSVVMWLPIDALDGGWTFGMVLAGTVQTAMQLWLLVYLWLALCRVYGEGGLRTLIKAVVTAMLYVSLVAIGTQTIVSLGLVGG